MKILNKFITLGLCGLAAATVGRAADPAPAPAVSYFIDVHEFGPGNVSAAGVAEAHQKDLAVQAYHGVHFLDYWVDEENGRVFCLSAAPDASSVVATHRDAHGLLPAKILPVTAGAAAAPLGGRQLFVDVHEFGPGNVSARAVAEAHLKDLAVEKEFGVRFLNYWVDEVNGKVVCLSEAPDAAAVRETHRRAHGLLPATIEKVTGGNP